MDFNLKDQERDIFDAATEFAQNEIIPQSALLDENSIFPKDLFKKAWERGLVNGQLPEKYGGLGLSVMESVLISQAIGYGCMGVNTTFMANDLALLPIILSDNEQIKNTWLPKFSSNPILASFCLTEPNAGSDAASLQTQLKPSNSGYVLNGSKMWITNAGHADLFVVYATIDKSKRHKGICAIAIDPKTKGVQVGQPEKKCGHHCSDTRSITFENVMITDDNIIAEPGKGWSLAMKTLDYSRPLVAASALGGALRAFDLAKNYANERKQFGQYLKDHPIVGQMLANMAIKVEAAKNLVYKAAWSTDTGSNSPLQASMAKAFAADTGMQVATDAVQVFGGYGYSKEYPIEKIFRDAKLMQIYEGTSQIQRLIISKELYR